MAEIKPFKALRYDEKKTPVPPVAPPYDIISEKRREEIAKDPKNIIHIDKPGRDDDQAKYERARTILDAWKKEATLITEKEDALYIYRQEFTVPEHPEKRACVRTGFFARLKLEEFSNGVVLPHEKTLSAPKADRLKLMKTTAANLSPIFGLYHDEKQVIAPVVNDVIKTAPLYKTYKDSDGTTHTLWRLTDKAKIATITRALEKAKIIIADGHHRYETALNYRDFLKNEMKKQVPNADYIMLALVDFSDNGLLVMPTHRLVHVTIDQATLLTKLKAYFDIKETTRKDLTGWVTQCDTKTVTIGLYAADKKCYSLVLKESSDYKSLMPAGSSDLWKRLNVSVLSFVVFKKVLGLSEAEFQNVVTYTHSTREAFEDVDAGEAKFSFLLQGIDKFTVKKISEQGELMPQKSTYFFPKLFTGFVMYEH